MPTPPQTADSVRLALPQEAGLIAAVQRRAWAAHADPRLSQDLLEIADLPAVTEDWNRSISRPPDARCRVLVALRDTTVVGFAATTPSPDADAESGRDGAIAEIAIDPVARRRGHGSRLLNACADTLRADGFTRATIWVPTTDDGLRRFLLDAGWASDGAHRELGTLEDEDARLRQIRLHTDLSEAVG